MSGHNRPPRKNLGTTLKCEQLEDRLTPADYYWSPPTGSDLLATNPGNWLLGSPLGTPATVAPDLDDHLYFRGTTSGQHGCVITTAAPAPPAPPGGVPTPTPTLDTAYAGLHLIDGYTGTVDLRASLGVGVLHMASAGAIAQNAHLSGEIDGGTLTITATLDWTGGTLNSGPVAGTIALAPGATGVAEPLDNGVVELGSSLILEGDSGLQLGSTLQIKGGAYELLNTVAGFVIQDRSLLQIQAPVKEQPATIPAKIVLNRQTNLTPQATTKGFIENGKGGTVVVEADKRPADNTDPAIVEFSGGTNSSFVNVDGTVVFRDRAWVKFNETSTTTFGGYQQSSVDDNAKPLTFIQAGCKITCEGRSSVEINDGSFVLTELSSGGEPLAEQPDVTIVGSSHKDMAVALNLSVGAAIVPSASRTSAPILLKVVGSFGWGGTVELLAHFKILKGDSLEITDEITVGIHAELWTSWFDSDDGNGVNINDAWRLVSSKGIDRKPKCKNLNAAPGAMVMQYDLVDDKYIDMKYIM